MKIDKNCVVDINYTLKNDDGKVIDTSEGREPLTYLHGNGSIIPGLENALTGQEKGFSGKVSIEPANAYGEYNAELIQKVPFEVFKEAEKVEPGMQFQAQGQDGQVQIVTVKEVEGEEVVVDANHPLAGETLNFDVTVEGVREATDEEKEHGHVH